MYWHKCRSKHKKKYKNFTAICQSAKGIETWKQNKIITSVELKFHLRKNINNRCLSIELGDHIINESNKLIILQMSMRLWLMDNDNLKWILNEGNEKCLE